MKKKYPIKILGGLILGAGVYISIYPPRPSLRPCLTGQLCYYRSCCACVCVCTVANAAVAETKSIYSLHQKRATTVNNNWWQVQCLR